MFKIQIIAFCLALVFFQTICRDGYAQVFPDAFSGGVVESRKDCVCVPSTRETASLRDYLVHKGRELKKSWQTSSLSKDTAAEAPTIIALFEHGQWRVNRDASKAQLPAYGLAVRLAETELQNGLPPVNIPFATVFSFSQDNSIVDLNVYGSIRKQNGHAQAWKPVGEDGTRPTITGQRDVDFGPYMGDTQKRILFSWNPPEFTDSKQVNCIFKIHSDGAISNLRLRDSTGVQSLDHAALDAIKKAAPFAKLPDGAPQSVDIQFKFDYNNDKHTCRFEEPVYHITMTSSDVLFSRVGFSSEIIHKPMGK